MEYKLFKSEFSDMQVEVFKSGWINIQQNTDISLGRPPNARTELILAAIKYVEDNKDDIDNGR